MQINYEFIKRILTAMVEQESYYIHTSKLIELAKSPYQELPIETYKNLFYGHLLLLKDNEVIEDLSSTKLGVQYNLNPPPSYYGCYIRLTSKGYDLFRALGTQGVLEKIKNVTLTEALKIGELILMNVVNNTINNL